jgi:DNA-damage-inducible protein J
MAQATLNVRMDDGVKRQFDAFCADVGMNASVAVNLFAKTVIRERRIPFDIVASDDPFYSAANQARLKKSLDQINAGGGSVHELIEDSADGGADALMK